MDPDRIPLEDDGEDGLVEQQGTPKSNGSSSSSTAVTPQGSGGGMRLIFDPLDELCRRLRRSWFASATRIEIANIEDHRMDYHFLQLRGTVFGRFPYVRLSMEAGSRYTLVAAQELGQLAAGSPRDANNAGPGRALCFNLRAATALNASRQPPEAALLLDPAEEIQEVEALFLQEHTAVFKSGDSFHFVHAPWRSFSGEMVRRRYRAVMSLIEHAASGDEPRMPGHGVDTEI
jgi:hypothetical protein